MQHRRAEHVVRVVVDHWCTSRKEIRVHPGGQVVIWMPELSFVLKYSESIYLNTTRMAVRPTLLSVLDILFTENPYSNCTRIIIVESCSTSTDGSDTL